MLVQELVRELVLVREQEQNENKNILNTANENRTLTKQISVFFHPRSNKYFDSYTLKLRFRANYLASKITSTLLISDLRNRFIYILR